MLTDHSEFFLVVHHALHIGLGLLILVVFSAHALSCAIVLTFSLHSTPVPLNDERCVFLLLLHDIVDILRVKVLDEVVFSAHCLDALQRLIPCLQQSPLLRLM